MEDFGNGASAPRVSAQPLPPVPRISLQAFCETTDLAGAIQEASSDRRLDKAHIKVQMGGGAAAIEAYRSAPTPNVIVIEATSDHDRLTSMLGELSQFCDSGTRVVVIGRTNDILLYRELMELGVSEYLISPVRPMDFIQAISRLYVGAESQAVGRVVAVVGAKGGVGASTLAHNAAWSIARDLQIETVIVDLDIAFGTAGLDFNQDPPQGVMDALNAPDRVDTTMVDRLLSQCAENLSILAAPATLDRVTDFDEQSFDLVLDVLRSNVPAIVLDMPHVWTSWSRRLLMTADDVVVVAGPDLANLRNAKGMMDAIRNGRPNDRPPMLALNGVGMLKRPEIDAADFAKAVERDPVVVVPFDAKLFGTATNNGQMLAEVDGASKPAEMMGELGRLMMGRAEIRKPKKAILPPFVEKLVKRKSS